MELHNRFMSDLRELLRRYNADLSVDCQENLSVKFVQPEYGTEEDDDPDYYPVCDSAGFLTETPEPQWAEIPKTNEIESYFHCRRCVEEWQGLAGVGVSPRAYQKIQAGWTEKGLQVWCVRHEINILHIDFDGQQFRANTCCAPEPEEKER